MKPGLLELLACPHDARPLAANGDGGLTCGGGHHFPVRDGVPRLAPAEQGPLGDQTGTFVEGGVDQMCHSRELRREQRTHGTADDRHAGHSAGAD